MLPLLATTLQQTYQTVAHNWPYLVAGTAVSTALQGFADPARVASFVRRHAGASVLLATALAVLTPLCSCGTMAVILGMMASAMPWAPIVAFMASSPLTSPGELLVSAGLFGWPFAGLFFATSIGVGLFGGALAYVLEHRGWLADQVRFASAPPQGAPRQRPSMKELGRQTLRSGLRLLALFVAFAFLGYLVNGLVPSRWIVTLFGTGRSFAIPLAAVLGVPAYFNSEASLPLLKAMVDNGASGGAALAFLVTGAGTSVGALSGALSIARWRVLAVVVSTLVAGALAGGYLFELWCVALA